MSDPTPAPNPEAPQEPAPKAAQAAAAAKPAAAPAATPADAPKAAKPPAPQDATIASIEPDHQIPALVREIASYGGPEPQIRFEQGPMPVVGSSCWMVIGELPAERRFWLCFTEDSINAAKTIAVAEAGATPSLLESFLIDEKKITLALLVSRLVQRLNGQKWLGPN